MCPALRLHAGHRHFQSTAAAVWVNCLNRTTATAILKWSYWDLSNSYEQRPLPPGKANGVFTSCLVKSSFFPPEYVILVDKKALRWWKTSLELCNNTPANPWCNSYLNTVPLLLIPPHGRTPSLSSDIKRELTAKVSHFPKSIKPDLHQLHWRISQHIISCKDWLQTVYFTSLLLLTQTEL